MSKKIMILGAGRGQTDLIKAAKKYGYKTVVASIKGNYPGFELADEICYADISNSVEISEAAKKYNVDGIVTACLDTGIAALGYTCEHNGLPGLSEKAAKLSGDKLLMKSAFMANGVSTARYMRVSSKDELSKVSTELNFPLIVKAVDLQGSRGINIVNTEEELFSGFENTMSETNKDFCIIEEFIDGEIFDAEACIVDGEVIFTLFCGDVTYMSNTKIPIGHYVPFAFNDEITNLIKEQIKLAVKSCDLNNCVANFDLILKDDKVYVIELTGRLGANCLPELISTYYGVDIYKIILDTALGMDAKKYFEENKKQSTPCYAKMLISDKSGKVKRIINNNKSNENIVGISFFVKPGDEVNKFTNAKDCVGQVIVKGKTLEDCEEFIDEVISNISLELE